MTIPALIPYGFSVGDGVLTTFTYSFHIAAASDLEVYVDGALTTAYTVTGVGLADGGTFVFLTAPALGTSIVHRRVTPLSQLTKYPSNGPFPELAHVAALDKLTKQHQDLLEELSRRPAFATSVLAALRNMLIPTPVALEVLQWNATADGLTSTPGTILQVTPDAVTGLSFVKTNVIVNASAGLAELTASNAFPAGTECIHAVARVTTAFGATNGLTGVALGDPTEGFDLWTTSMGITLAAVSNTGQHRRREPLYNNAARDVLITALGGPFDATGTIKITTTAMLTTPDA